jgi:ATP-dependent DNA helicase RecG
MSINVSKIKKSRYEKILKLDEGHFVDLKSKDIQPGKLTRSISAFANTDGGELYIGIREDKKTKTRFWEGFENVEAANGYLQIFDDLFPSGEEFSYTFLSYASLLVLHVEIQITRQIKRASTQIPYIRVGAQNKAVETVEALTQLRRNKGIESFEDETTSADISEIAHSKPIIELLDYKDIPHSDSVYWLEKQHLIHKNKPTVCGVLLFAEEPQAIIPKRCGIKIYRYKTDEDEGYREALASQPITIEGWADKQIKLAVKKTVETVEGIAKLGEKGLESISYPFVTLHEIITNAVLHRDYSIADDIHIRIFDNRIEVESPGKLPGHITEKNILKQRCSRNGKLNNIINKFPNPPNQDIGEGLKTAFREMQKLRLKNPEIKQLENKVVVYIFHESLASPEEALLEFLERNPRINKSQARKICHIDSDHKMTTVLQRLVKRNIIEPDPTLKGRAYAYRKCREGFNYDLVLHQFQIQTIQALEDALEKGQQKLLISMANGSIKVRTYIVFFYRLLKRKQFDKILLLVKNKDRLKEAIQSFHNSILEEGKTFAQIFTIEEINDNLLSQHTKVDIATVQIFGKRFLDSPKEVAASIAKQYDCVLMDDCYQNGFKKIDQVLAHFDTVKIAVAWTQEPQTIEMFGEPIYTYSDDDERIEMVDLHNALSTVMNPTSPRELLDKGINQEGYGNAEDAQTYLDNFNTFVRENLNKISALLLVIEQPQELTRSQVKELRSLMDTAGYSEQGLQDAWRDVTNNDIAASILGFIRQATLEEPLITYGDRVDRAMNKLLISKTWTAAQSKWLERIGQQFKVELIVDRDALERGQFKASGGFERINTIFEGRLEEILREINDALWHELVNK